MRFRIVSFALAVACLAVIGCGGSGGWPTEQKQRLVFARNLSGNQEVFSVDVDGKNLKRLTTSDGADIPGGYSPDGKKIVFSSARNGDSTSDIYTMNRDGTNVFHATTNLTAIEDVSPSYSPDGSKILFGHDLTSFGQIWIIDVDGQNATELSSIGFPTFDFNPRFSPDGSKIVHMSTLPAVRVMDADGQNQYSVYSDGGQTGDPSFDPSGTRIIFQTNKDGDFEIYTCNIFGLDLVRITNNPARDVQASFSPDGTKIAFVSDRDGENAIYIMDADGSNVRQVTHGGDDSLPSWSPE